MKQPKQVNINGNLFYKAKGQSYSTTRPRWHDWDKYNKRCL